MRDSIEKIEKQYKRDKRFVKGHTVGSNKINAKWLKIQMESAENPPINLI